MAEVTVTINGEQITVEEGSTILEAATKAGYEIPTFCYSEQLKPFTSCFMCVVKLENGRGGKLVPSCSTTVTPGMEVTVESEEIQESRRMCLNLLLSDHCGDCLPPCEATCPASIDIKGFLELVTEGREAEAAKRIRETAPFPGILGRVCPAPCEEECRRNRVDEPISICYMKRYIADSEREALGSADIPEPAPDTGKRVAIVGAGPAGLTAAYFLRLKGHSVTVFEAKEKAGGMLRYGIPYYRLPDQVLHDELDVIERMGATVTYNTEIGKDIAAKELERDFDCLMLAIGAQGATSMRVEGEDTPGVFAGIEFLDQLARGERPEVGEHAVVVGGGNTAIDAARSARRLGADVTILYRRSREQMPANEYEVDEAIHEGVKIEFLVSPLKLRQAGENIVVDCTRMELGEPDASGRRRPIPIEGSEFVVEASSVIGAIGQRVLSDCIADLGVERTRWGTIEADPYTFMTNRPGIFSFGDCQSGADIAVRAVGNGRKAACAAHQYLSGEEVVGEPVLFNASMGPLYEIEDAVFEGYEKKERIGMPALADKQRITTFEEVETGFSSEEAREEARRCLKCGCDAADECKLRDYATLYNADQNLFVGERRGYTRDDTHELVRMDIHKCISCGSCVRACAEVKGLNVLSFVGRGFTTRMTAPFGRSLVNTECDGCGECVKVCPTAALMEKDELGIVYKMK